MLGDSELNGTNAGYLEAKSNVYYIGISENKQLNALKELGLSNSNKDVESKPFGMNWKMTAKTILVQLHHKIETFESINKHLVR